MKTKANYCNLFLTSIILKINKYEIIKNEESENFDLIDIDVKNDYSSLNSKKSNLLIYILIEANSMSRIPSINKKANLSKSNSVKSIDYESMQAETETHAKIIPLFMNKATSREFNKRISQKDIVIQKENSSPQKSKFY